jgi:TatD DNase family protein
MLNVGTGSPAGDSFEKTVALTQEYDSIFGAVGIHPHDASEYSDDVKNRLTEITKNEKILAWGEIGLDFHYDFSPRDTQKSVFRRQIRVASELGLPIIIHSRSADEETTEVLKEECAGGPFHGGIMHCFGGTPEMACELMEIGFLISFAGNVTFKKADNLREAAAVVPIESLLVETDCPYLTPVPFRGKRNEPARVVETAKFLADFYGIEVAELAAQTTSNFIRFFGLESVISTKA